MGVKRLEDLIAFKLAVEFKRGVYRIVKKSADALGSLEETKRRLKDGIDRGYFTAAECADVLELGNRCGAATMALAKSLRAFAKQSRRRP